jgi:hypothetical protein
MRLARRAPGTTGAHTRLVRRLARLGCPSGCPIGPVARCVPRSGGASTVVSTVVAWSHAIGPATAFWVEGGPTIRLSRAAARSIERDARRHATVLKNAPG